VLGACTEDLPQVLDDDTIAASGNESASLTLEQVEASTGTLDDIVEQVMTATGVPGVAVAVVYEGEVVYEHGYGVRNTTTGSRVTPQTVFQIASMSKPISSTIMAGMAGQGVFDWDDPIAEYAPQFRLSDSWVSEHVTFADLFSHRSGIPGGSAGNDLEAVGHDRSTILERMAMVPLDPFRITYSYSNYGMTMAGESAAIAAGGTWEQESQDVLFGPAGMTSTSVRHQDFVDRSNRADLHVRTDDGWSPDFERQPDAQAPAGGVSSNVSDLARWMEIQLSGGSLDGERIIDEDTLDETHTPQILKSPPHPAIGDPAGFYGLGWNIGTDSTGAIRWDHSGAFSTGASTTVKLLPSEGLGIVVLTNGEPIGAPEAITDSYLSALQTGDANTAENIELWTERFGGIYGEPVEDWANPPTDAAPARDDAAYLGTYTNDYVGAVSIVAGADGLEILLGPDAEAFAMRHWDGDVFSYIDAPELPDFAAAIEFTVDDQGVADAVTISSFDGAGQGTLRRI